MANLHQLWYFPAPVSERLNKVQKLGKEHVDLLHMNFWGLLSISLQRIWRGLLPPTNHMRDQYLTEEGKMEMQMEINDRTTPSSAGL